MSNLQVEDIRKHQNIDNADDGSFGLNISNLTSDQIIKLLESDETLRVGFFQFKIYENLEEEKLDSLFSQLSINSQYFEDFISYIFIEGKLNILNSVVLNSSSLFEVGCTQILHHFLNGIEEVWSQINRW